MFFSLKFFKLKHSNFAKSLLSVVELFVTNSMIMSFKLISKLTSSLSLSFDLFSVFEVNLYDMYSYKILNKEFKLLKLTCCFPFNNVLINKLSLFISSAESFD